MEPLTWAEWEDIKIYDVRCTVYVCKIKNPSCGKAGGIFFPYIRI